jgi:hypothetical protein
MGASACQVLNRGCVADYQAVPTADLRWVEERIRELERQLGCETFGIKIARRPTSKSGCPVGRSSS